MKKVEPSLGMAYQLSRDLSQTIPRSAYANLSEYLENIVERWIKESQQRGLTPEDIRWAASKASEYLRRDHEIIKALDAVMDRYDQR